MAEIPDDTGLKAALRGILNEADLEQLTKRAARRQLETKLGEKTIGKMAWLRGGIVVTFARVARGS